MQKKIPQRQCVACRGHFDKKCLARVVRTPDGQIVLDTTGKQNGRGAYVCKKEECLKKAVKSGGLGRALGCTVAEDIIDRLKEGCQNETTN